MKPPTEAELKRRLDCQAETINRLKFRVDGHARLIEYLYARVKHYEPADEVPRIYRPFLETKPAAKLPAKPARRLKVIRRKTA